MSTREFIDSLTLDKLNSLIMLHSPVVIEMRDNDDQYVLILGTSETPHSFMAASLLDVIDAAVDFSENVVFQFAE